MKIAIIAPNKGIPVPPEAYGGTERSVADLCRELVKLGQEVILFAEPGSSSPAQQIIHYPRRLTEKELEKYVRKRLPADIDIIHDNTFEATIARAKWAIPTVCSFRNADKTYPVKYPIFLSKIARRTLNKGKGFYVYNGINLDEYPLRKKKKEYLLFLGRPKPHKGIHIALEVARRTKRTLIIAGPQTEYVQRHILAKPAANIIYVGSVGGAERLRLLGEAACLLFPTNCFEAFGRVIIEALACGTPVLSSRKGSVPEIMKGFPNYLCHDVEEMIAKLEKNHFPSPEACRAYVAQHFTARKMAKRYLRIYEQVVRKEHK